VTDQCHEERADMIEGGVAVFASLIRGKQPQQSASVFYYLTEKRTGQERGPYFFVGRLQGHEFAPAKGSGRFLQVCSATPVHASLTVVSWQKGRTAMRSKTGAGIVAGLLAGVVFGIMMHLISTPMAMGGRTPMMTMMARVVHSDSLVAGWIYILVSSVLMGGIFGIVLGDRATRIGRGLAWGALYGILLWVLGALVLMPLLLGMEVFAPLTMAPMRPGAWQSLGAHILSGLILGGAFARLYRRHAAAPPQTRHK
jgi:hypothetical protein